MAKYFVNEDKITQGKELWLALIANELAEANRLMRLELEMRAGSFRSDDKRFKELTEDRA